MGQKPPRRLTLKAAALALAVLGVLVLTLTPGANPTPVYACGMCSADAVADVLRNLLLFAPVGVLLVWNGWRTLPAIGVAVLLTVGIEVTQLLVPGRQASVFDVMSNAMGAACGILLARTTAFWWQPPRGRALLLAGAGLVVAAAVWLGTLRLLRPALPLTTLYGQWTPQFGDYAWYGGHVTEVSLAGMSLPSQALEHSDSVRAALLSGSPLTVRAIAGPTPRGVAPIFSLAVDPDRFIVLIAADGDDLVLSYRTRAVSLRLDQPRLRMIGALRAVRPGTPVELTYALAEGGICAAVNGVRRCTRFSGTAGWALLGYPPGLTSADTTALGALWTLLLVLPSCYWLWCARKGA